MAGDSVKKFNNIIQDQNPTRPALQTVPGTRQHAVTWPSINNACPTVDWNGYRSSDPILNFCPTSSTATSCDSSSDFLTTLMKIFTGVTAGAGLASTIYDLVSTIKSNKSDKADAQDSGSGLRDLINDAENVDKKTSKSELTNIANNFTSRINSAETKLNNAKRSKETATTTISNLNSQKTDWETKLTDFDTAKSTLEADITDIEGQLATMAQDAPQYAEIKAQLDAKKKELQEKYSDTKRNEITKQISRLEKDITKWEKTKSEAQDLIDTLPDEIKDAKKSLEKINKKINKQS